MKPPRHQPTGPINWDRIRERLARATAATEEALRPSPQRAREVLAERARALARVPAEAPRAAEVLEVVRFELAGEHYALETRHVREVVRLTDLTPVPAAPPILVGVLNLRGEILAVFDLRRFFGLPEGDATEQARVLVLGHERAEFGILADAVQEVQRLRTDEVLEPPATVAGVGREYVRGVTGAALIVLDGAVLFQDRRLFIDQAEEGPTTARGERP
jgi:purine-binding chemotaxis protein CheW